MPGSQCWSWCATADLLCVVELERCELQLQIQTALCEEKHNKMPSSTSEQAEWALRFTHVLQNPGWIQSQAHSHSRYSGTAWPCLQSPAIISTPLIHAWCEYKQRHQVNMCCWQYLYKCDAHHQASLRWWLVESIDRHNLCIN